MCPGKREELRTGESWRHSRETTKEKKGKQQTKLVGWEWPDLWEELRGGSSRKQLAQAVFWGDWGKGHRVLDTCYTAPLWRNHWSKFLGVQAAKDVTAGPFMGFLAIENHIPKVTPFPGSPISRNDRWKYTNIQTADHRGQTWNLVNVTWTEEFPADVDGSNSQFSPVARSHFRFLPKFFMVYT